MKWKEIKNYLLLISEANCFKSVAKTSKASAFQQHLLTSLISINATRIGPVPLSQPMLQPHRSWDAHDDTGSLLCQCLPTNFRSCCELMLTIICRFIRRYSKKITFDRFTKRSMSSWCGQQFVKQHQTNSSKQLFKAYTNSVYIFIVACMVLSIVRSVGSLML